MESLSAHEIRRRFLAFFEERGHAVVKSSSLVPANDPTLLFTNAGMVQFKDVFTGRESRAYSRAASSQRCLRAGGKHNDLDNVGFTPRHHTMFEMLGNFSFGDYFKKEAIAWGWEFLTRTLGIPAERLVVSIYNGEGKSAPFDEEAYELWKQILPEDRIWALDDKENFWSMGDTGPCGPCSEIHIFHGDVAPGDAKKGGKLGPAYEDDKYTELWNLVFMQYEQKASGEMVPLPKPSIDTGAGLERLAAVLAGVRSNYETDLLAPLVEKAKTLAGVTGPQGEKEPAFQVIADHARATSFLISDGIFPDKKEREYVLRRIMRRAIRYGTTVGLDDLFFHEVCQEVVERFAGPYPELRDAEATIAEVVKTEETAFRRTLKRGLTMAEKVIEEVPEGTSAFPVEPAAVLYDTHGFPIDLTGIIAREHGLTLDEDAVANQIKVLQAGGEDFVGKDEGVGDLYFEIEGALDDGDVRFDGYDGVDGGGTLLAIVRDGASVTEASEGDEVELVFDHTPFYAESGGQEGDAGKIEGDAVTVDVTDTKKPTGRQHFHVGKVQRGTIHVGDALRLRVDPVRRDAIRRNHSATHLLHHALREVLGSHVTQKGSLVAPDRLRFDFSHGKGLTRDERAEIERRVNTQVLGNRESQTRVMGFDDAKASGAMALFGEKYDDDVRVVNIGSESVELCGGTHVARAGDIGAFVILTEGGIAQGVRRIEAVTGLGAVAHLQRLSQVVDDAQSALHAADAEDVLAKVEKLQADLKRRAKEVDDLKRKLATGGGGTDDQIQEVEGIKVLAKSVGEADPKTMRAAADTLRDRLRSGVVVLAAERGGKANLLVAVTKDLLPRVHAGKLVGKLAAHVDGRGGGKPELAQAGGAKVAGLSAAVEGVPAALRELLADA